MLHWRDEYNKRITTFTIFHDTIQYINTTANQKYKHKVQGQIGFCAKDKYVYLLCDYVLIYTFVWQKTVKKISKFGK